MRFLFNLYLLIFLAGCATHQNFGFESNVAIKGGVFQDDSWTDALVFKRYSWNHDLTLYYDAYLSLINPKSPFMAWFSSGNQTLIQKNCPSFIVALLYNFDDRKISHHHLEKEMDKQGFEQVVIDQFKYYLSSHPDFEVLNLANYKITGFCSKRDSSNLKVFIDFPSFKRRDISL